MRDDVRPLLFFFFVSGMPALIYQIIWQRALFAVFGSNIEAVTLVVSAFMLGLGLGSLFGGRLSVLPRPSPLVLFALFELAIGLFGMVSLPLISAVGAATIGAGPAGTFVAAFLTVLVPTLLMGATLPLLVVHLLRRNGEVGESVGLLYSINTLGSAVACFAGAFVIFGVLGMQGSVLLAAAMNLATGAAALVFASRLPAPAAPRSSGGPAVAAPDAFRPGAGGRFGMPAALLLVGVSGYVSLSFEILWTRVFYLDLNGRAIAFPVVLGLFLVGIAVGSSLARRLIAPFRALLARNALLPFALLLLFAGAAGFLVVPALIGLGPASRSVSALMIVVSAAAFGALLPLASDAAITAGRGAGLRVSQLYVANIVGSTAGTIVTGYVLLDQLPLEGVAALLFLIVFAACGALFLIEPVRPLRLAVPAFAAFLVGPALVLPAPALHSDLYETLQFRDRMPAGYRFDAVVETRSGVVTVTDDRVVFGTGVYDGIAEVDLIADRNGLFRVTALAAVHAAPKEVLVIGLASAAWTQILAGLPGVERITAVEINPGYLPLIARYGDVRSVLDNPMIDIVIDDGRRWLRRNPHRRFDLIVANTTFHWRAGASNLLSVEYLELVRRHLKSGGVYYYNTTSSERVQRTAASVFPHAARFEHFMMASDSPIAFDKARWRRALRGLAVDGRPLLDFARPDHRRRADEVIALADRVGPVVADDELANAVEFRDSILERTRDRRLITDDNMGTEWPVPDL